MAVWNAFIWLTFAKNLSEAHADGEDRATGYWVAHTMLIVVNLALGVLTRAAPDTELVADKTIGERPTRHGGLPGPLGGRSRGRGA